MSNVVQKDCNLGLFLGMLVSLTACGSGVAVDAAGNPIANANTAQPTGTSGPVILAAEPTLTQKMPDSAGPRDCLHCAP